MANKQSLNPESPLLRSLPSSQRGLLLHVLRMALAAPKDAVRLSPDLVVKQTQTLAEIAGHLPVGGMAPIRKAALRRIANGMTTSALRGAAHTLRTLDKALNVAPVTPEQLDALALTIRRYLALRDQAARGMALSAKLRKLVSAYAWFLVTDALDYVVARIEDPQTPVDERELLLERSAALLRHKEELLRAQERGQEDARARDEAAAAEAELLRKEALIQDVTLAIKNGWPLDAAALNQAAAYHAELHGDATPETRKASR